MNYGPSTNISARSHASKAQLTLLTRCITTARESDTRRRKIIARLTHLIEVIGAHWAGSRLTWTDNGQAGSTQGQKAHCRKSRLSQCTCLCSRVLGKVPVTGAGHG